MEYFVQQLINGLTLGAIYGLIAIGYTMVYGIIGMINFAHGDIFMVGAFIALITFTALLSAGLTFIPLALLIVLIISMSFTAIWGWTVERLAYPPLRESFRLAPSSPPSACRSCCRISCRARRGARVKPLQPLITGGFEIMENALVSKMKLAKIDVLYYGGYHPEAGLIARQMRAQGLKTVLMSGDALVTADYWKITGDAGEGTLMTFSLDPRKNPVAAKLVKRFRDKGIEPEGYVLYTYAAMQVWRDAVEKAGSVETDKVVKALNSTGFGTVIGKFSFNKKGDPNLPPYAFFIWSKGDYQQIN